MRETGRKDKNNKDICLGDIIEHDVGNKLVRATVILENGNFALKWHDRSYTLTFDEYWNDDDQLKTEVIGNVRENPELLA